MTLKYLKVAHTSTTVAHFPRDLALQQINNIFYLHALNKRLLIGRKAYLEYF